MIPERLMTTSGSAHNRPTLSRPEVGTEAAKKP